MVDGLIGCLIVGLSDCRKTRARLIWPNAIGFLSRSQAFYDKLQLIELETFQALVRFTATRDGDQEIHVLTNLPSKVSAVRVADLYRQRWTLEQAFNELTDPLALKTQHAGLSQGGVIRVWVTASSYNVSVHTNPTMNIWTFVVIRRRLRAPRENRNELVRLAFV